MVPDPTRSLIVKLLTISSYLIYPHILYYQYIENRNKPPNMYAPSGVPAGRCFMKGSFMLTAEIVSQVRTPRGRLKGYKLIIDGQENTFTCNDIKNGLLHGDFSIPGLKVNSAGALISTTVYTMTDAPALKYLEPKSVNQSSDKISDPLIIRSASERKRNSSASERVKNSSTPVAFIKRRIR